MNSDNEKKEEKKGVGWPGVLRGSSSGAGGASSGLGSAGSAGGLGGLFATKAGVLGVVLGAATIAAGVGVLYNFMGPSSKPVYTPQLFQNSYIEEEAQKAGMERAVDRNMASSEQSTLDMFSEQAKKDGIGGLASEAGDSPEKEEPAGTPSGENSSAAGYGAGAAAAAPGAAAGAGAPKLQTVPGFGSSGAGGTKIPTMQTSAGLSGGIGGKFASIYRPPVGAGKASVMKGSVAAKVTPRKYSVNSFNKKGAFGQAKYAGKLGGKAAYSADASGARTEATEAFTGETQGTGDVGSAGGGVGLGGAGVSNGDQLKGSDPSLSSNNSTPPPANNPKNESPWQKWMDDALYGMLAWVVLFYAAKALGKSQVPWMKIAAIVAAVAAAAAAAFVIYCGYRLMTEYKQTWMGVMYMAMGAYMCYMAIQAALSGSGEEGDPKNAAAGAGKTAATGADNGGMGDVNKPIGTNPEQLQLKGRLEPLKPKQIPFP